MQEPGTFHLFISKVRDEDNGTYICQVNTDPPINKVSGRKDIINILVKLFPARMMLISLDLLTN